MRQIFTSIANSHRKEIQRPFSHYSHRKPLKNQQTDLIPLTTPYNLLHKWVQITLENCLFQHLFRFHHQSTTDLSKNTPNKPKNLSQETDFWSWSKNDWSTILYRQISKASLTNSQPTKEYTKLAQKLKTRHYTRSRSKSDHATRIQKTNSSNSRQMEWKRNQNQLEKGPTKRQPKTKHPNSKTT